MHDDLPVVSCRLAEIPRTGKGACRQQQRHALDVGIIWLLVLNGGQVLEFFRHYVGTAKSLGVVEQSCYRAEEM